MKDRRIPWALIMGVLILFSVCALLSPSAAADTTDTRRQRLTYLLQYVFDFVEKNYVEEVDPEVLAEGAFKGIFESLGDPHSAYLTASDLRGLLDTTSGEFGGVGLYINKQISPKDADGRDLPAFVEVVAPIEGTPAFRAGIQAGDLIIRVEGESTENLALDEVVEKLRGRAGTTVTITIRRGPTTSFDVSLSRANIQVPTVRWAMMPNGIAYLRIIQFTHFTPERVAEAVAYFQEQNYTRMIIDLRSNPGGLLDAVVAVANMFFDDGIIVSTRSRLARENRVYSARPGLLVPDSIPLAVLIDNGSASASEIFAGAIKDRNRGTLFGTKSYGKGSVQQVHELPFAQGGFRLTMSRYYTPGGVTIDKVGIEPHRTVSEPEFTEEETASLSRLIESRSIPRFVQDNPEPSERVIANGVAMLAAEFPGLSERLLRRLIRNEINRHMTTPPVYDLEYDTVLREAVAYLEARS